LESNVHLLGYRSDVRDLMQAADVIVHPSTAEGLSLVLIEAQMLQKPIVATAVGGASEVLGQEAGLRESAVLWIAKAGAPKDLATRIQGVLASLAKESKAELCSQLEQSAERAQEMFSIQRNANRLVEVASSLLAAPAA
jgi:glycosyltransferase involved in cell wall biosynthesis